MTDLRPRALVPQALAPESLDRAMAGVDAVVTSAAGYTRHRKGDSPDIDRAGNANLAGAAARAGVRRFVLTSILTCDQTPQVPHFWHKKLMEDRLQELGVPFVALRPGAFLDQVTRFGGDPLANPGAHQRRVALPESAPGTATRLQDADAAGSSPR